MIYEGLSRTGEIESIKIHGGGEIAEVYGGIGENNPIFYKSRTLTGTAPLTFKGVGKPLTDYTISGNTIRAVGCGERTGNLFNTSDFGLVPVSATASRKGTNLGVLPSGEYTLSASAATGATQIYRTIKNGSSYSFDTIRSFPYVFTADGVSEQIIRTSDTSGSSWENVGYSNIMLNVGSTATPYEPYGYKIPIVCGGETKNVYIGNYPLNKVGEVTDDVQFFTQKLIRRIDPDTLDVLVTPTTEQITMPEILTTAGSNALSIGTTVQPSAVSIIGNIKPTGYGQLLDSQDVEIYDKNGTPIYIHG